MAARRFADRDAPSLLRDVLGSLSVDASHAVGPLEYRAGMDRLAPDIAADAESAVEATTANGKVLMVTGKRLLRKMGSAGSAGSAADDAFVLVEPRIGPALSLSRLDFRRGNAHLLGVVAAWRAECARDLGIALEVTGIVRRSILGGGGIVALVGATPKCRVVSDVTPLSLEWDVLSVVVGPRAVTASADLACLGRPDPADVRAILFYKGKRLPVLNGTVSDDIVDWFLEAGRPHPRHPMDETPTPPWSDGPCTRAGCTQQPHQPSGTTSFCYCSRCPRDAESRCTTCGSMDMTEPATEHALPIPEPSAGFRRSRGCGST